MIRLFLKNYKEHELRVLYNALADARATVATDAPSNVVKDLDEVLLYLCGYTDAKGDSAK